MRRRITRALIATAAAGATITIMGLTAAGSAGAATAGHKVTFAPSAPGIGTAPCSAAEGFAGTTTFPLGGGGCAGYMGSGRDFRYAQANILLPQTTVIPLTGTVGRNTNGFSYQAPSLYVGLASGDAMAAAGFMTCANYVAAFFGANTDPGATDPCHNISGTPASPTAPAVYPNIWVAVAWIAANSGAVTAHHAIPLTGVSPGDGVKFAVYYPTGSTAAHFTVTTFAPAASAGAHSFQLPVTAVFDHAVAAVDYSASRLCLTDAEAVAPNIDCNSAAGVGGVTHTATFSGFPLTDPGPAATADLRITQFNVGAWTTAGGARGTFKGVWMLNAASLTNNGLLPPLGTTHVEPAYLWNDGLGNGFGDAFGVWWRH